MKLLALDTATPFVVVAAYDGDRGFERVCETPMKHGEQVAPLIQQVLADAGWSPADLTGIVVGVGPGPFTGLRVGLVTARTMGFALDIPVHGLCTLDAFAIDAGIDEPFTVVTDARRREVYLATYEAAEPRRSVRRTSGPEVVRPAEAVTVGTVVGPGTELYPDTFGDARGPMRPSAITMARAVAENLVEVLPPEPLYLRRPDAVEMASR
ncbi:tRNA (adenosine(37)-N6)-threonylcarbamoyltransferase complex dimerization subunit type 1 TsaB [Nocardioides baekrokdamisoli]|uniref:tRNA (Adenosine(37)-N6)-threonylcarbamoyltransferase complex dimerization subunit type 1 TsaB n=1 Tax=Nocardioides baekrokdamisoli TaxID=1804624 RepID=A0A3G9J3P1_9ACTN|nr:tRNA (adenosine(37)-N6)-threonylcarbamoyltransferase complex dimerization subunit type 1 TsaB [Nocardioides baekrokdamisoli]BBH18044.1 tRNA (adenosine(37)-N6)-threonylcarbamoyltransferase complex dimerization subunit type 1 TsaB [Nocardioides baekrokdamisoli]